MILDPIYSIEMALVLADDSPNVSENKSGRLSGVRQGSLSLVEKTMW